MAETWPIELRLSKDKRTLTVRYDDDAEFALAAELLRVHSPSAEVQGHSPEQRQLVAGKFDVEIVRVEPVGNYAVRLHFDDRHDTGLFSWPYLRRLGEERESLWTNYLEELAQKGWSRQPVR